MQVLRRDAAVENGLRDVPGPGAEFDHRARGRVDFSSHFGAERTRRRGERHHLMRPARELAEEKGEI
jgi:hypothetical protein